MRCRRPCPGLILLLLAGAVSAGAVELDFSLASRTAFGLVPSPGLQQDLDLSGTLRIPVSPDVELAAAGFYGVTASESGVSHRADLTRLYGRARILGPESLVVLEVGRIGFSDPTGFVANMIFDGVSAAITSPELGVDLAAGYSGALFGSAGPDALTPSEASAAAQGRAPARLVASADLTLPELFLRQSIVVSLVGTLDLPELAAAAPAESFSALYASLVATGPITTQSFYTVFGTLGLQDYRIAAAGDPAPAGAAGVSLRLYFDDSFNSALLIETALATGASGTDRPFTPVTNTSLTGLFSMVFGNIFAADVSFSTRPVSFGRSERLGLRVGLSGRGIFRLTEGEGSLAGAPTTLAPGYLGSEAELAFDLRPLSDLRLALAGIVGLPGPNLVAAGLSPAGPIAGARLSVQLGF